MTMARILVHLDTREGLEEKITLHSNHYSRRQILDYEGVPFWCRRCHKVGHLFKECSLVSPSSPHTSKGKKHMQTEDPLVDEQPSRLDSHLDAARDIV